MQAQPSRERQTEFIFVICLLEAQQAMQVLEAKRVQLQVPTKRRTYFRYESPLIDALWAGYNALRHEAADCAKKARDYGQLLFCFEGTTVLQGGAQ